MANDTGLFLQETSASMAGGAISLPFDNSYARLPERFYARLPPTPVAAPRLVKLNTALAAELGLDRRSAGLAGRRGGPGGQPHRASAPSRLRLPMPATSSATSCRSSATAAPSCWARSWAATASVATSSSKARGRRRSRARGDGRAALGPVLREYIISEAMAALGIPTTRSLAAVMTGEPVLRETALPGAVLTRVASSHIRVGTFQFFAARGDIEALRLLADHVIARHYPDARGEAEPYRALFDRVIARQAELIAQWMLVGFIHGVMNTDNMLDRRRDHRLRSVRLHGRLQSRDGVQLHRSRRPLRLRPPAAHRQLEPRALRRDPAAAAGRRHRCRTGHRQRIAGRLPGTLRAGADRRHAAQARPVQRGGGRRRPGAGSAERHGRRRGRFHPDLPPARSGTGRRGPGAVRESRCLRRLGRALARAAGARAAGRRDAAGR